jgi:hypothetical protein
VGRGLDAAGLLSAPPSDRAHHLGKPRGHAVVTADNSKETLTCQHKRVLRKTRRTSWDDQGSRQAGVANHPPEAARPLPQVALLASQLDKLYAERAAHLETDALPATRDP